MDVFCQREYLFVCRDASAMKLTAGPSVWLPLWRVMLIECAALLSSNCKPLATQMTRKRCRCRCSESLGLAQVKGQEQVAVVK